jgi:UDP-N-acetylglucosamine 2-epimerase (non-hydrolysing)
MTRTCTLLVVVGARPNFMKVAPLLREIAAWNGRDAVAAGDGVAFRPLLVHTGQHYDPSLSDVFFGDLELPAPDYNLGVGSGSHAQQTAAVMTAIEPLMRETRPDLVVVVGDINSTLAAALTAAKLHVPVAHIEAGLRSRDRRMPEETNRIVADHLSDLLFTTCADGDDNLVAEGVDPKRIVFVGNPMIDALDHCLGAARDREAWEAFGYAPGAYALVTLHRPENVDDPSVLGPLLEAIAGVSARLPVLFPMHLRTRAALGDRVERLATEAPGLTIADPIGYLDFLSLQTAARLVITDSGELQEETTALGVPCITTRVSTERPITVTEGTNRLVSPTDPQALVEAVTEVLGEARRDVPRPALWDGRAAERIVAALAAWWTGAPRPSGDQAGT